MKISKLERVILLKLNKKSGSCLSFFLFRELKIPMADFLRATLRLENMGMIHITDNKIYLKPVGFGLVVTQLKKSSFGKSNIPSCMLRTYQIAVNSPYIPALSRLDRSLNPRQESDTMPKRVFSS